MKRRQHQWELHVKDNMVSGHAKIPGCNYKIFVFLIFFMSASMTINL